MLRSWFSKLESLSERYQAAPSFEMTQNIRGEVGELPLAALKLRDPKIYSAVLAPVRDCVGQTEH